MDLYESRILASGTHWRFDLITAEMLPEFFCDGILGLE